MRLLARKPSPTRDALAGQRSCYRKGAALLETTTPHTVAGPTPPAA